MLKVETRRLLLEGSGWSCDEDELERGFGLWAFPDSKAPGVGWRPTLVVRDSNARCRMRLRVTDGVSGCECLMVVEKRQGYDGLELWIDCRVEFWIANVEWRRVSAIRGYVMGCGCRSKEALYPPARHTSARNLPKIPCGR